MVDLGQKKVNSRLPFFIYIDILFFTLIDQIPSVKVFFLIILWL